MLRERGVERVSFGLADDAIGRRLRRAPECAPTARACRTYDYAARSTLFASFDCARRRRSRTSRSGLAPKLPAVPPSAAYDGQLTFRRLADAPVESRALARALIGCVSRQAPRERSHGRPYRRDRSLPARRSGLARFPRRDVRAIARCSARRFMPTSTESMGGRSASISRAKRMGIGAAVSDSRSRTARWHRADVRAARAWGSASPLQRTWAAGSGARHRSTLDGRNLLTDSELRLRPPDRPAGAIRRSRRIGIYLGRAPAPEVLRTRQSVPERPQETSHLNTGESEAARL